MDEPESLLGLHKHIQLPPYTRAMWAAGAAYAAEVALCTGLLWGGYAQVGAPGANWAVVSSVVVLQPGLTQSFQALVFRIAANLLGAFVGFGFGWTLGTDAWQVIAAMMVVVFCCLALRLEQSLRTACVSVIIVMTANVGDVVTTSVQRVSAVAIGSVLAVTVQLLVDAAIHRVSGRLTPAKPVSGSKTSEE